MDGRGRLRARTATTTASAMPIPTMRSHRWLELGGFTWLLLVVIFGPI